MANNRDALLAAAVRCLHERGFAHTSARDLVAESGTNLGAIGYHFGSKDALINEAIVWQVRNWIDALGAVIRAHVADGGGVRAVLEDLFATTREHQAEVTAFFEAVAQAGRADALRTPLAEHYERFRGDVLAAFRPLLAADAANDRALASVLLALADGLIIQYLLDPANMPSSSEFIASLRRLPALLN